MNNKTLLTISMFFFFFLQLEETANTLNIKDFV